MSETPSSLPVPPDELIDRVVSGFSNEEAEEWRAAFVKSGRRSLEEMEAALVAVGDTLSAHESILEFGCGCGRIMRWMQEIGATRKLTGTDIDARAIEWASENLPFARFDVNEGLPPTRYGDGEFDLVLNHSVFTHLDEHYQDRWLAELQRITAPGGLLVLTIHGEHVFHINEERLGADSPERREWRAVLERDGILFITEDTYVGGALPDFYHTTFHAPRYIFEHWSRWFDVLAYLPRSALGFQDQVVLRRREDSLDRGAPIRVRPEAEAAPGTPSADIASVSRGSSSGLPVAASRVGSPGLLERAIFRATRPLLDAQRQVDQSLGEAIASIEQRLHDRLPPLVGAALRAQAERMARLERDLHELRRAMNERAAD